MRIVIAKVTEENVGDIPEPCRGCLYWEFPEAFERGRDESMKSGWFKETLENFGDCGKILYVDGRAVGYAQYGPSDRFPNVQNYRSGPAGSAKEGVIVLTCLFISDRALRGVGLGGRLLEAVIHNVREHGFKALETFARRDDANNPSGPMKFYLKRGFQVKDETNPEFPLIRLDLI